MRGAWRSGLTYVAVARLSQKPNIELIVVVPHSLTSSTSHTHFTHSPPTHSQMRCRLSYAAIEFSFQWRIHSAQGALKSCSDLRQCHVDVVLRRAASVVFNQSRRHRHFADHNNPCMVP